MDRQGKTQEKWNKAKNVIEKSRKERTISWLLVKVYDMFRKSFYLSFLPTRVRRLYSVPSQRNVALSAYVSTASEKYCKEYFLKSNLKYLSAIFLLLCFRNAKVALGFVIWISVENLMTSTRSNIYFCVKNEKEQFLWERSLVKTVSSQKPP